MGLCLPGLGVQWGLRKTDLGQHRCSPHLCPLSLSHWVFLWLQNLKAWNQPPAVLPTHFTICGPRPARLGFLTLPVGAGTMRGPLPFSWTRCDVTAMFPDSSVPQRWTKGVHPPQAPSLVAYCPLCPEPLPKVSASPPGGDSELTVTSKINDPPNPSVSALLCQV